MDARETADLLALVNEPPPFFLFGMGGRRKLIYCRGELVDALRGERVRSWTARSEKIVPEDYRVLLTLRDGSEVAIAEDETGIRIDEAGRSEYLSTCPLKLPTFAGHPRQRLLRILHHEILVNVIEGLPVPNYFVYRKPWHRDAAMMCMVFEMTGNMHVVKDWILGLSDPFDHNNKGADEPDNLGQVLYMLSLVTDKAHPMVARILGLVERFRSDRHIAGSTDYAQHPVYQTKWLKFGLRRLGLPDPYVIPNVHDSYSSLFWMDFRDSHVAGDGFPRDANTCWPYLGWAEAHFHRSPPLMDFCGRFYPVSWEARASEADYSGMQRISAEHAEKRLSVPHTWHAAEMFLYLVEQ